MTAATTVTQPRDLLRSPGYRQLLLLSALVGIPVSLVAFGFVALSRYLERQVWKELPQALGHAVPPWWWPLPALGLCGVLVACAVALLPGRGGHIPAKGLAVSPTLPSEVPGVMLAALAGLSLGAVVGPEAPLLAIGSGLALMTVRAARRAAVPQLAGVLGAAGSAAAISTIFGSPLVAGVLLIETSGLGGPQLLALALPCLLASGVGALVFHGFGDWTGLDIDALSLPVVPPKEALDAGDFLWGLPLAGLIAALVWTPALAVGLAAGGAAVMRLPVSASVLATLLLGRAATDQMPLIIIAAMLACAIGELLRGRATT